eukprot:353727-Chlamydomonas_euryale.AAC.4
MSLLHVVVGAVRVKRRRRRHLDIFRRPAERGLVVPKNKVRFGRQLGEAIGQHPSTTADQPAAAWPQTGAHTRRQAAAAARPHKKQRHT